MGRKRVYATRAERDRAYRERHLSRRDEERALKEALTRACERGWCTFLVNRLPDEPRAWMRDLAERLAGYKLVAFEVEEMQPVLDLDAPEPALPAETTFHGSTYDAGLDGERLNAQQRRVWRLMRDGRWRTLREISDETRDPEASVSARLRDFRKLGWTVDRQRRGEPGRGLWEYRLRTS